VSRFEIVAQLMMNWGRVFDNERIGFFVRRLNSFTDEELSMGMDILFDSQKGIPDLSDIRRCCFIARGEIKAREKSRLQNRKFRPGDVVDGLMTLTPAEAANELRRLEREYPDWMMRPKKLPSSAFGEGNSIARKEYLQHAITQIVATGLRRCAALDPNVKIEAKQAPLF